MQQLCASGMESTTAGVERLWSVNGGLARPYYRFLRRSPRVASNFIITRVPFIAAIAASQPSGTLAYLAAAALGSYAITLCGISADNFVPQQNVHPCSILGLEQ